jgi:hypothetical protein
MPPDPRFTQPLTATVPTWSPTLIVAGAGKAALQTGEADQRLETR